MSAADQQNEEREVLLSIYEGDDKFKSISPTTYQYKYGEDNDPKSFLLEISWTGEYPAEKPTINLDTFYNKHLLDSVKEGIRLKVEAECEPLIGEAMTYTLFEWVKEHETELTDLQPEVLAATSDNISEDLNRLALDADSSKKGDSKKVQLTKSQKRRQWDRADHTGEKPRGSDWVDIVKHLSQTGGKPDQDSASTL